MILLLKLNNFLTSNKISWLNCVGMCTDGCPTMLGIYNGLIVLIQKVAPHVKYTHCMIHRGSLASKKLPKTLNLILGNIFKKTLTFI